MAKHDDLTKNQKELYDALKDKNGAYIELIKKATKEDIKAILDCKFDGDLSLLEFIVSINSIPLFNNVLKKLQKIYTEHPDDNEARKMSRKFFTSPLEVEVNQEKKQVRPLDYIIINDYALAELFVTYATERKINLKDLTIQDVGQVDENINVKEFVELVKKKMEEAGLPIDQYTPHSTQNEQQPLQSNLQDTDPLASVSAGTGPEDNDNLTEDQQKLYDNLKSAIKGDGYIAKLLQDCNEEVLRQVLTVKQEVTFDGMKQTFTLLGYAMLQNEGNKQFEAILKNIFTTDNQDIIKEILTAEQKVTFKSGVQETLTLLCYAMNFHDSD